MTLTLILTSTLTLTLFITLTLTLPLTFSRWSQVMCTAAICVPRSQFYQRCCTCSPGP